LYCRSLLAGSLDAQILVRILLIEVVVSIGCVYYVALGRLTGAEIKKIIPSNKPLIFSDIHSPFVWQGECIAGHHLILVKLDFEGAAGRLWGLLRLRGGLFG